MGGSLSDSAEILKSKTAPGFSGVFIKSYFQFRTQITLDERFGRL